MFFIQVNRCFALVALLSVSGFAESQTTLAVRPELKVGDSWEYSFTNYQYIRRGCTYSLAVEKIEPSRVYARLNYAPTSCDVSITSAYPASPGSLQKYDENFNHFFFSDTAYKAFAFPLEIGKTWSLKYKRIQNGWTYDDKLTGNVVAFESVTTPAGTFDAFKISLVREYEGTKTGQRTQTGSIQDTVWYSPAVKNFVKREYTDVGWSHIVRELLKYSVQ